MVFQHPNHIRQLLNDMLDAYFSQTLDFCQEWLSGKEFFTIHTSGSTGTPKPIQVHRRQMQASALATAQALGLQAGDTAFVCLNTAYIAGKMMLVRGLEIGMNMVIVPPSSNPFDANSAYHIGNVKSGMMKMESLPQNIIDLKIDFFSFVPLQILTILKSMTNEPLPIIKYQTTKEDDQQKKKNQTINYFLNQAKAIIIGGAPVSAELEELLQSITSPVYATYGMTETVSHIALKRLNGKEKSPYYQALPHTIIGQDERKCLTISSPVTNFEKIITNDKVNLIDNQHFEWLGRLDNAINSGGVKIQIEKIENEIDKALLRLNISNRFLVVGLPDSKLGEAVSIVVENENTIEENYFIFLKINELLKEKLNKYELPKSIHSLKKFPETATNKINRLEVIKLL